MAVIVDISTTMTTLWNGDSATSPAWSTAPSLMTGFQREGSGCLGLNVSNTTTHTWTTVTSFDFNNNRIYIWILPRGEMDTLLNGGVRIVVGDGTNRMAYYVAGSDYTTPFTINGWFCYVLDRNNLPAGKFTIAGSEASMNWSAITQVGVGFKTLAKALGGSENCFWDIGRQGTGLIIRGGTSIDSGKWVEVATDDASTASGKAYGIVMEFQPGVYGVQGQITIGDSIGTTSTYFKDAGATVVFMDTGVGSGFYKLDVVGNTTGTNSFIDGIIVGSGDTARGRNGSTIISAGPQLTISFSNANVNTVSLYGTRFVSASQGIVFGSNINHEILGCAFAASGQINTGGVIVRNCTFSETTSAAGSLLWSSSINIKNSIFVANTTGAGIQHTTAIGSPFAYDNLTFSGNTYDVNNTSGSAIEVNKNNGSNPSTYTGSLVTFLGASVTTQITVKDLTTGGNIENARVLVWPTDGTNFPYEASINITGSGTTATVTHTSHGLATGDYVIIRGANEDQYNGVYQITVTGANTYTYTTSETITASPATGAITATFAFISGLTNINGVISDTRQVGTDQPIAGRVRKSSVSSYYQQGLITGTISSVAGYSTIIQLVRDE